MRVSGTPAFALIGATAFLMFGTAGPSHAQGMARDPFPQHGVAVPDGLAAMVHVFVPVGDDKPNNRDRRRGRRSNRTFTFSFGSSWRDQTGSPEFTGPRYISTAEAGFTDEGEAVLKVGPVDLIKRDEDSR